MSAIYRYQLTVPPSAIDENQHVNNVQYIQWMQDAAARHADAAGCTDVTRQLGAAWVVRSHHVEYLRPAFNGDALEVLTWVSGRQRVRSLRKYRFVRAADGVTLANGQTEWILVDVASGRPRAVPDSILDLFTAVSPEAEGEEIARALAS